jgi:hypothetical protein
MAKYYKLTDSEVKKRGLSTYSCEVILICADPDSSEKYYFNAQEFFSQEELDSMDYLAD